MIWIGFNLLMMENDDEIKKKNSSVSNRSKRIIVSVAHNYVYNTKCPTIITFLFRWQRRKRRYYLIGIMKISPEHPAETIQWHRASCFSLNRRWDPALPRVIPRLFTFSVSTADGAWFANRIIPPCQRIFTIRNTSQPLEWFSRSSSQNSKFKHKEALKCNFSKTIWNIDKNQIQGNSWLKGLCNEVSLDIFCY